MALRSMRAAEFSKRFRQRACRALTRLRAMRFGAAGRGEGGNHPRARSLFSQISRQNKPMARKYSKKASADVERVMKKRKAGTLKSGRSGKEVTSRKQAIAIGLSEARAEGKKVPKKAKKTAKKKKAKKSKR
jgi:hypothetical protein